jgi:hypothetical protein
MQPTAPEDVQPNADHFGQPVIASVVQQFLSTAIGILRMASSLRFFAMTH